MLPWEDASFSRVVGQSRQLWMGITIPLDDCARGFLYHGDRDSGLESVDDHTTADGIIDLNGPAGPQRHTRHWILGDIAGHTGLLC